MLRIWSQPTWVDVLLGLVFLAGLTLTAITWYSVYIYIAALLYPLCIHPLFRILRHIDSTDPYNIYKNEDLVLEAGTSQIRLLTIKPGYWADLLVCELRREQLNEDLNFDALSYAWAENYNVHYEIKWWESWFKKYRFNWFLHAIRRFGDRRKRMIQVNGEAFEVAVNLEMALRHLRKPTKPKKIWADAICINQDDFNDRNAQVGAMDEVYESARKVIIWLGPDRRKLSKKMLRVSDPSRTKAYLPEDPRDGKDVKWYHHILEEHLQTEESESEVAQQKRSEHRNLGSLHIRETRKRTERCKQDWYEYTNLPKSMRTDRIPDYTEQCFSMLDLLSNEAFKSCDLHLEERIPFLKTNTAQEPVFEALAWFMDSHWWNRLWVVQETAVAKKVVVRYGRYIISWNTLKDAAKNLNKHRHEICCSAYFDQLPARHLEKLTLFAESVQSLVIPRDSLERKSAEGNPECRLLILLWQFRSRSTSNPRDKVFALVRLANYWGTDNRKNKITPQYEHSVPKVYKIAIKILLKVEDTLDPLLGTTLKTTQLQGLVPSWISDWSHAPTEGEISRLDRRELYQAGKKKKKPFKFHDGNRVLGVKGYLYDEVSALSDTMPKDDCADAYEETQHVFRKWQALAGIAPDARGHDRYHDTTYTFDGAYRRTICMNSKYTGREKDSDNSHEIEKRDYEVADDKFYEDWSQHKRELKVLDDQSDRYSDEYLDKPSLRKTETYPYKPDGGPPSHDGAQGLGLGRNLVPQSPRLEVHRLRRKPTASEDFAIRLNTTIATATVSRRFFITKEGYMGLGPDHMEVGDQIAVLDGGRFPFILRTAEAQIFPEEFTKARDEERMPEAQPCYQLVGDCYVQGIMNTEVPDMLNQHSETIFLV